LQLVWHYIDLVEKGVIFDRPSVTNHSGQLSLSSLWDR